MQGRVRIISGRWRRRIIRFDAKADIRPTTDAVRETLFNWLRDKIENANCLDLFAGSGALGLEALSRDAGHVVFVDTNPICVQEISLAVSEFQANNAEVVQSSAENYLKTADAQFDVVFVDPPFFKDHIAKSLQLLVDHVCLNPEALVYVESEATGADQLFDENWEVVRSKSTSSRSHFLIRRSLQGTS